MTMPKTLITSKDPKGRHAISICEAAYNKAELDRDQAQRLNERGGEFKARLIELIGEFSHVDGEVISNYGYPLGYVPEIITSQILMLSRLFNLNDTARALAYRALAYVKNLSEFTEGAEGYFAIPKWQAVAETYGKAVEKILALIGESRNFKNLREGQLGEKYLRQSDKTEQMFAKFCEQQEGDILIVPAQFGFFHRGRSVSRSHEIFTNNEFGLGAFAAGCMLLTHPQREQTWEQLHIYCAGDEFALYGDGKFLYTPVFDLSAGVLRFQTKWSFDPDEQYGSVSGFLN